MHRGAPAEAAHVVGARREHRIRQRGERVGLRAAGLEDRVSRGATVGHDELSDRLRQRRVQRHQCAGGDDLGVVRAALGGEPLGERLEVARGALQRRQRAIALAGAALRGDLLAARPDDREPAHDSDGDARRRGHAAQLAHNHLPLGGDGLLQRPDDQRRGGRARVLMADRALAQVRRAALARLHRDRRQRALLRGLGGRVDRLGERASMAWRNAASASAGRFMFKSTCPTVCAIAESNPSSIARR